MSDSIEKIISLAKRRGFIYPGSEIYGGLANSWDYGPLGVELKNNIKQEWWKRFVQKRGDMVGIDAALIMNPKVWEASGHLKNFTDPLVECKNCHERYRADFLLAEANMGTAIIIPANPDEQRQWLIKENIKCPKCGEKNWDTPKQFNLMLKTFLGAAEEKANEVYFRPETAQGMFVDFKQILETSRKKPPFGVAQIGKAFRNEITPGNFIFRTREFEQMEIEYFIPEPKSDSDEEWNKYFEEWLEEMRAWIKHLGINYDNIYELEVAPEDRAHYSKRTIDFEYKFPFGQKELYGLAYRGNFDLTNHSNASGEELKYQDPTTNEKYIPHVIEPTWGVDRSILAAMCEAYQEEKISDDEKEDVRIVMKLPKWLAPIKVAVLPLMKKSELADPAKKLADELREEFSVDYDETQSIGKRYRRQDEIGTPYCVTFDFDSLSDNSVTVRDRDSMKQERILIKDLKDFIANGLKS